MDALKIWVEETLPGEEGWFKEDTPHDIAQAIEVLDRRWAIPVAEIKEVVEKIVSALRNEYGD